MAREKLHELGESWNNVSLYFYYRKHQIAIKSDETEEKQDYKF